MSYDFYNSEEYKKKQGELARAAWKRGVFDFFRKKVERVCLRVSCKKTFTVNQSNIKKYCSQSCAAKVNNFNREISIETRKKISEGVIKKLYGDQIRNKVFAPELTKNCLNCGNETPRYTYKYCCNACQIIYQRDSYIKKWKAEEIRGLTVIGTVSPSIKRYLRDKYGNKCCLCGWSEVNPKSGIVPLVADHIDGNWKNNKEENLRLLCPNCDSLTPTYQNLNRGNGRKNRAPSKRRFKGGKASKIFKFIDKNPGI